MGSSSQPVRKCYVFGGSMGSFPRDEKINPMTSRWRWHGPDILVISSVIQMTYRHFQLYLVTLSESADWAERKKKGGQAWNISSTKIINGRNAEIIFPIGFKQRSRHLESSSIPLWHFLCVCTHINANLVSGVRRAFSLLYLLAGSQCWRQSKH